ncbi:hypothetical protein [Rhizobium rhizogenes]|uniref:hypothetical protein n=1 Tax=Rhizobium rhizogenes TaxID=359 RepID=UPI001294FBC7|nr:hypothetical protein [Rhizobium rhizogenes]MQB34285.1 hypothetical protein [Rhizobium rhizogenes]
MSELANVLKLRVILQVTPWLIMRARKRSPRIGELLNAGSFVMQISTRRGAGGHFLLCDGRLRFRAGSHPAPDLAQTWITAGNAVSTLSSRDETELLRAIDQGQCSLKGDFLVALWFNEAIKLARNPTPG